jgi:hypothetical protein
VTPRSTGNPGSDPSEPTPAEPTPADLEAEAARQMLGVNARVVVFIGVGAFFIAFVVLLPFWSWLTDHGHRVWLWTALAGWVLGALALPLVRKHSGEGRLG